MSSALSLIDTTSDPLLGSDMARAPRCSPAPQNSIKCTHQTQTCDSSATKDLHVPGLLCDDKPKRSYGYRETCATKALHVRASPVLARLLMLLSGSGVRARLLPVCVYVCVCVCVLPVVKSGRYFSNCSLVPLRTSWLTHRLLQYTIQGQRHLE